MVVIRPGGSYDDSDADSGDEVKIKMSAKDLVYDSKVQSYKVLEEYQKLHDVKLPRAFLIEILDYISFKEIKFYSDVTRQIIKNRMSKDTDYFTEAIKMVEEMKEISKPYVKNIFERSRREE